MPRQEPLYQWTCRVTSRLPTLTPCQARVLALWSFGIVLCRRCALSAVVLTLSQLLHLKENTLRQRLREFYQEAARKRGTRRLSLDASVCFAPLLQWAAGDAQRVALALDVTNLADRFHVLAIAVLCRGGAVPVAWTVLRGNEPGEWNPHWQRLLELIAAAFVEENASRSQENRTERTVTVLTDRGLESDVLFLAIKAAGFHPLMRLKSGGTFRPQGWRRFHRLSNFAPDFGTRFRAEGELYKTKSLACTLLACRAEGCDEAWLLATDLESAEAGWYAMRSWIEHGFKLVKRGGWQWQHTRMSDPARVERLWVAIALATLWVLEAGAAAEPLDPPPGRRTHSLFTQGVCAILIGLLQGRLVTGRLPDDTWPQLPHRPNRLTRNQFQQGQDTYP